MLDRDIVIVEPICRGSRLDSLALIVRAIIDDFNVHLITRADYRSDHFFEMLGSVEQLQIHTVSSDLNGAWIKSLNDKEWKLFASKLIELDQEIHPNYKLVFAALDDYMSVIGRHARVDLRNVGSVYFAKYRVSYLHQKNRFRDILLNLWTRQILRRWDGHLIVFDERLASTSIAGRKVMIVPDPWVGSFSPENRCRARAQLMSDDSEWALVAVGRQVPRKGFDLVMNALPEIFTKISEAHLYLFGAVGEMYTQQWQELKQTWPDRISHSEKFLPQEMMPLVYAMGDVVLLPYSKEHTATSGVLPRAAASGVPVVASSHGAIGKIVKDWSLGECFETGDPDQFMQSLLTVYKKHHYPEIEKYAEYCSPSQFMAQLRHALLSRD